MNQTLITWIVIIVVFVIGFWSAYKENKKEFKKIVNVIRRRKGSNPTTYKKRENETTNKPHFK